MVGFNRRFDPHCAALSAPRRGRDRRGGDRHHPSARSLAPSSRLCQALGRALPRHDDPRPRHGALPSRRGADRGPRHGRSLVRSAIGDAGDLDTAVVIMETKSGSSCRSLARAAPPMAMTSAIEAHGSKGMFRADNMYETTVELADADGYGRDKIQNFFLERYASGLPVRARRFHHRAPRKAPFAERRGRSQGQSARRRRRRFLAKKARIEL